MLLDIRIFHRVALGARGGGGEIRVRVRLNLYSVPT